MNRYRAPIALFIVLSGVLLLSYYGKDLAPIVKKWFGLGLTTIQEVAGAGHIYER